jgi:hypothetical protein
MERGEKRGERLLRLGVDARRRLVEDEERGLAGECLGDEGALLHPAGERPNRAVREGCEADAVDRLRDERAVFAAEPADQPARCKPARRDDLADRRGRVAADLRSLREVAERVTVREAVRRLAVEQGRSAARPLEPEDDAHQRGLAPSVRPCERDELAFAERETHVVQHVLPGAIGERDPAKLDR